MEKKYVPLELFLVEYQIEKGYASSVIDDQATVEGFSPDDENVFN